MKKILRITLITAFFSTPILNNSISYIAEKKTILRFKATIQPCLIFTLSTIKRQHQEV